MTAPQWAGAALLASAMVYTAGCTTHFTPAPSVRLAPLTVNGVQLLNATPESQPRIYFSDGITKYSTDYRGWTQSVIESYGAVLARTGAPAGRARAVSFAILGINCSGHYVADCSMSLQVSQAEGVSRVYTTATFNGWPISSALHKAIEAGVSLALNDVSLNAFVGRKPVEDLN